MSRHCLVMLRTPLVAQDLALTLQDITGCAPVIARTTEDACQKLARLNPQSLRYAFIQSDAASLRGSRLHALIQRLGGQPVLVGHAAELEAAQDAAEDRWPVLAQPFGSAQVAQLVQRFTPPLAHRRAESRADFV